METMGLYKTDQCWMMRCKSNLDIFGCMDVATAFTAAADSDMVLQRIKALNPDSNVILIHG
jgi:hypothetical protein